MSEMRVETLQETPGFGFLTLLNYSFDERRKVWGGSFDASTFIASIDLDKDSHLHFGLRGAKSFVEFKKSILVVDDNVDRSGFQLRGQGNEAWNPRLRHGYAIEDLGGER